MHRNAILAVVCLAAVALGGDDAPTLTPDPPSVAQPKCGSVTVVISPAEKVKSIRAVSRATGKEVEPESFDRTTGKAVFADLPGDANYDICLTTTDGREIEGVDLEFVDTRLERLAAARRRELDLPAHEPGRFTEKDVAAIREFIAGWEDFLDTRRILYIQGHGDRATVLVELMRLKEFHASGSGDNQEIIWRVELWYMQNAGGGWERIPNVERMLQRFRGLPAEWRRIHVEYTPALTVTVNADGTSEPLTFEIPATPDPATARPANTKPALDTQPKVLGVDT